ncbi:MAG TPA: phospholipase D-like domain-containing protein [Planctomycetota bacterium]|nr:phospholipase D-like domain-containing protein [Planctomycetota bacterium]
MNWKPLLDGLADLKAAHIYAVLGFLLGLLLTVRLLRDKEKSSVTFAWLLAMIFVPWVGVPLYLLLGGRKLHRRARGKPVLLAEEGESPAPEGVSIARLLAVEGVPQPRHGNSVEWLDDGQASWRHLVALIAGARTSLDVSLFIVGRDEVGGELVRLLAERARAGVRVRLLVDALGSLRTRGKFLDPLRQAGGRVGVFMPMLPLRPGRRANLRNHRKLAVADGCRAWAGGMNVAHEYLGPDVFKERWIDLAVGLQGPVVADLLRVFASDWAFATREVLEPPADTPRVPGAEAAMQLVPCGPDVPLDPLSDALFSLVSQARRRVVIVTPYFVPDDALQRALVLQARMGREVLVLLPAKSNHGLADVARRPFVRELVAAGARVMLVQNHMVHAKFVLVDDGPLLLGSANVDLRSLYLNFELGMLVEDPATLARAEAWLARLQRMSLPADGKPPGLSGAWLEDGARLLAPML